MALAWLATACCSGVSSFFPASFSAWETFSAILEDRASLKPESFSLKRLNNPFAPLALLMLPCACFKLLHYGLDLLHLLVDLG